MPLRRDRPINGLIGSAALGAIGSALLALASDLPASPFGPHAGGLWPFAASGSAGTWEGPRAPRWAVPANVGSGVPSGHLLVWVAALVGVVLLMIAWLRLWRTVRVDRTLQFRNLWWVFAAWTAPLLFAAPFASQDVWVYAAQGKVVASGLGSASPVRLLGHSVWLSGVDPKYRVGGTIYGPGAVGLSALFASISGQHPWIAAEAWRLAVIAALLLCAWGVALVAASRRANPVEAVVAGVANPAILVLFVASIHNDAVMIGLVVAGIALAVTERPWAALGAAALAVTIKAPAALAVLAIAWWSWKGNWHRRAIGLAIGIALTLAALWVVGLGDGGGFGWLKSASFGTVASSFSILAQAGIASPEPANLVQLAGIVAAVLLVLCVPQRQSWVGALAAGFAVMAVCATNPQPWYLLWALPIVACTLVDGGVERVVILVIGVMAAWSELPLGVVFWFEGILLLTLLWVASKRSWHSDLLSRILPTERSRRAHVNLPG